MVHWNRVNFVIILYYILNRLFAKHLSSAVGKANMVTQQTIAAEANMTKESFLHVDFMQLKFVSRFFTLHMIFKKEMLHELFFPSSVTVDDCQYFPDTIIQSWPILPKLLSVLHASAVLILADYFCVDLVFEELKVYFTHNPALSPFIMKLFCMYYSMKHPQTIAFYHALTDPFRIPQSKCLLKHVSCMYQKNRFVMLFVVYAEEKLFIL